MEGARAMSGRAPPPSASLHSVAEMQRKLCLVVDVPDEQAASQLLGELAHAASVSPSRLWSEPYEGDPTTSTVSLTLTREEAIGLAWTIDGKSPQDAERSVR